MIKARVVLEGEVKEVTIPQSWQELSFETYYTLIKTRDLGLTFFGVPSEEIAEIDQVAAVLNYLKNKRKLKRAMVAPEWITDLNIGRSTWKNLEAVKQILKINEGRKEELFIQKIIHVYYPNIDLMTMKAGEVLGAMSFFFDKLNNFFEKYKRLQDYKPTQEEIRAGVDELNRYGYFPTLMSLCKSPLEYDDMLKQPADIIYMTLLVSFEKSEIQRRMHEFEKMKK
jgi:hypothetical protein